jgi:uncharacterized protein (TIRG00374 family)
MTGVVACFLWWLWRLLNDVTRSHRVLAWFIRTWNNRLGRWRRLDEHNLDDRLTQFQSELSQFGDHSRWKFILTAFGRVLLDAATLGLCFQMYHSSIDAGTLLTGYGLILLLSATSALPGGLGLADASVPVIFHRLGVQGSTALVAGLTYRLLTFWLIRFIGYISWQYLESRSSSYDKKRSGNYENP